MVVATVLVGRGVGDVLAASSRAGAGARIAGSLAVAALTEAALATFAATLPGAGALKLGSLTSGLSDLALTGAAWSASPARAFLEKTLDGAAFSILFGSIRVGAAPDFD